MNPSVRSAVRPVGLSTIVFALAFGGGAAQALAKGGVAGVVRFAGPAPTPVRVVRTGDPRCSSREVFDPTISLGKDGKALKNVFVRLSKNVPKGESEPPSNVAVIDQIDCMYVPRVVGAMEGQKVMVMNADAILHNVHAFDGDKTLFNQAYPPKTSPVRRTAPKGVKVMTFKCDIHPWMLGYVLIVNHPFFSVSNDEGKFEISGLPAGDYELEAWHEKLGTQTVSFTVESEKTTRVDLTFGAPPSGKKGKTTGGLGTGARRL